MRIRVITVTYRGTEAVIRWAGALEHAWSEYGPRSGDRLVVLAIDNASGDGTVTRLRSHAPWVEIREQPDNRGFAAGCNLGLATREPDELVVILNPDVAVRADFFERLAALEWPAAVAARGPRVSTPSGAVEQSARGFPRPATALFGRTSLLARLLPDSRAARRELRADVERGARPVDWVSGACMVIPASRFDEIGQFDEGYFMYWEDADWCRRAATHGLQVRYEPDLEVVHFQGSSSAHRPVASVVAFHRSAWRYQNLHLAPNRVASALAATALAARCAIKVVAAATAGLAGSRRGRDGAGVERKAQSPRN